MVIRAVYEELQPYIQFSGGVFPIKISDRLYEDLQIDPDDLDIDIWPVIAQRTGRSMENIELNIYYKKVHTAGDLVLCINGQPKKIQF